jgi:hypothetical protein
MKQLVYVLQFKGKVEPAGEGKMKASMTAAGLTVDTIVGKHGLNTAFGSPGGREAVFQSDVEMNPDGSFKEWGTIRFGDEHSVQFTTALHGVFGPSADPTLQSGAVVWKVESGTGEFEGATGYITSNFVFNDEGLTDNQLGVVFLKD